MRDRILPDDARPAFVLDAAVVVLHDEILRRRRDERLHWLDAPAPEPHSPRTVDDLAAALLVPQRYALTFGDRVCRDHLAPRKLVSRCSRDAQRALYFRA